MHRYISRFALTSGLVSGLVLWELMAITPRVHAQITPDASLGQESSFITPNINLGNELIDRIDGGAVRSDALFHSFSDFNVNDGQQVYFSNPTVINHIFSRVTGANNSNIFGTLGVLGDANLYLINPNGILFGPNAQLDVRGSFVGTTATGIEFTNGEVFSATAPTSAPLLFVNSPVGLANWLPTPSGTITSMANLTAGQDLALMANTLNLTGQLAADDNLTLEASGTLTINDAVDQPFIAAAGNTLLLQGNNALTINAVSHPDSGLFSGADMILRSDGTIIGDAQYFANGNFRIEQMDGNPGRLSSPNDPVIRASGDVSFDSYLGTSLHILAGGNVSIGDVVVTGPDTVGNSLQETITLSNGSTIDIDGSVTPTVDIRAGTNAFTLTGTAPITPTGFIPGVPATDGTGTGANINIGTIANPGGLVFLTNQFEPNPDLTGDIAVGLISTVAPTGGGDVIIDSAGELTFSNIDVSGGDFFTLNFTGDSGDVTLLADDAIFMPLQSFLFSFGVETGDILLESKTAIVQEDAAFGTSPENLSFILSENSGSTTGGDISLVAPEISLGGNVVANSFGTGDSGAIVIDTDNLRTNQSSIFTDNSSLLSLLLTGMPIFGTGNSGPLSINATEDILIDFTFLGTNSTIFPGGGNAGDVEIEANNLTLIGGVATSVGSLVRLAGDAGDVTINVQDTLSLEAGTQIISSAPFGTVGNSGTININTGTLSLADGGRILNSFFGVGDAPTQEINVVATNSIAIDGAIETVDLVTLENIILPSGIVSEVFTGGVGQGGTINIETPILQVTNGGTITASTDGDGDAGNININATQSATFDGISPINGATQVGVTAGPNTTGVAGLLTISTPLLQVLNGAEITAETEGGIGAGGNLIISADQLRLENQALLSAETVNTDGGNITLNLGPLLVLRNGSNISATAGTADSFGNGGNVNINIPNGFIIAVDDENSNIAANAFLGDGGNVNIATQGLFGIEFRESPSTLSDITASSEFGVQGSVDIETPDIDPSDDLVELPSGLVDASRLVAQGCGAGASNIAALGEFTVTGRGGLPPSPDQLTAQSSLAEWETFEPTALTTTLNNHDPSEETAGASAPGAQIAQATEPKQIVEFQGWVRGTDGEITLTASASTVTPHSPWNPSMTCQARS